MNRRTFVKATGATAITATAFNSDAATSPSFDLVKGLIMDWRKKSIDGVLGRLTDDIAWYSHVGTAPKLGKPAVKAFLDVFAPAIEDVKWVIYGYAINGQSIYLEGADDFILLPDKRRVAIPYAGVLTFRGNLISEWRDYFDRNLFDKLKAGEPTPPEIQKLLSRPALF